MKKNKIKKVNGGSSNGQLTDECNDPTFEGLPPCHRRNN